MRTMTCLTLALFLLAATAAAGDAQPGQQRAKTLDANVEVKMKYLLYLPKQYVGKDSWPLLLFLHGSGERGDDIELVKKHGPPKLIAMGQDFPFIVVSPQCPSGQRWRPADLKLLIDQVGQQYKVDPHRVYVTGLSMGGSGTWRMAIEYPDDIAAIVPICGSADVQRAKTIKHLPIWVFHGAKDRAVPIERSEQMVAALKKAGGEPKLTVDPEAGHDSWSAAYDTKELYDWLLQQNSQPK